jgi:alkylated DNA nucleotide flippase Atl1
MHTCARANIRAHTQILATLSNESDLSWHPIVFNAKQYLFQQGQPTKKEESAATISTEEFYTVS